MIYIIITFLISLFLVFSFWKLGEKYQIQDEASDDPLKIHKKSTSVMGGSAIFLTFALVLIFLLPDSRSLYLIIAALPVFLLGFFDDLNWRDRNRINPIYKFLFLILACFLSAFIIAFSGILAIGFFISLLSSFAVIFILINAINYQDGMDALAGGTVLISLLGFIFLSSSFSFLIASIVSASLVGFLVFNWPPAKIFMGDSGAYFLGFVLSILFLINFNYYNLNFSKILGLIFILGLPLFDGVYTNIRRLISGKSIFRGDRGHFFDRLHLEKGFSVLKTIVICYSVQIAFVIIGLLLHENTFI